MSMMDKKGMDASSCEYCEKKCIEYGKYTKNSKGNANVSDNVRSRRHGAPRVKASRMGGRNFLRVHRVGPRAMPRADDSASIVQQPHYLPSPCENLEVEISTCTREVIGGGAGKKGLASGLGYLDVERTWCLAFFSSEPSFSHQSTVSKNANMAP
jgi:hypothetical protein